MSCSMPTRSSNSSLRPMLLERTSVFTLMHRFCLRTKVRLEEFNVVAQGISINGAIPGEWGNISLNIINTGTSLKRSSRA